MSKSLTELSEGSGKSTQKIEFKKLDDSESLGLPYDISDKFNVAFNSAVDEYHRGETTAIRVSALKKIQAAIRDVEVASRPSQLAKAKEFHQLKNALFTQIKEAYSENDVKPLLNIDKFSSPLAYVIDNMSGNKVDKLFIILSKNASRHSKEKKLLKEQLRALYDKTDSSVEADQWRLFISFHTIEFLGGINSKNYKVTNLNNNKVKILKVDNRLNNSRSADEYLRTKLGDILTPIDTDRQVVEILPDFGEMKSRTLLVTDFCPLGSVEENNENLTHNAANELDVFESTHHIMKQMAQVFINIDKANCCFPDAKWSNWLVDHDNHIRVADTKSFLFTQDGEYHITADDRNKNLSILRTKGYIPPELDGGHFNADKIHAYLLGTNLQKYLKNAIIKLSNTGIDRIIFKEILAQYDTLIVKLTDPDPDIRIGVQDALDELNRLNAELAMLETTIPELKPEIRSNKALDILKENIFYQLSMASLENQDPHLIKIFGDIINKKTMELAKLGRADLGEQITRFKSIVQKHILKKEHEIEHPLEEVPSTQEEQEKLIRLSETWSMIPSLQEHYKVAKAELLKLKDITKDLWDIEDFLKDAENQVTNTTNIDDYITCLNEQIKSVNENAATRFELCKKDNLATYQTLKTYLKELHSAERNEKTGSILAEEPVTVNTNDDLPHLISQIDTLQRYTAEQYKKKYERLINRLRHFENTSFSDPKIADYIFDFNHVETHDLILLMPTTIESFEPMKAKTNNLEKIVQDLETSPQLKDIQDMIESFKKKSKFWTIGMKAKAQRIENALHNIDLDKRSNILENAEDPAVKTLLKAIASHRKDFTKSPVKDEAIHEKHAAKSYRTFIEKFKNDVENKENKKAEDSHREDPGLK